jgi:HEAT repeats
MLKQLKSSNEAQRQQGIEIAIRLGKAALSELHTLLGHTRRDIRNSAAIALGQIGDPQSLPYLVGGLYGTASRASQFRPTVDTAASAIAQFGPEHRIQALKAVKYPIRPTQIQTILEGTPTSDAYEAAEKLRSKGFIFTDWSESDLPVFVAIDESRAWPQVMALVGRREESKLEQLYTNLSLTRRTELLKEWTKHGASWSWHYSWLLNACLTVACDPSDKMEMLFSLEDRIREYNGKFDDRDRLLKELRAGRSELQRPVIPLNENE